MALGAELGDQPWPGRPAAVGDRPEGGDCDQAQRLRGVYLRRLAELVPPGCRVTILADRGFGDQTLFAFLGELRFGYVIRFRCNIHVTAEDGETKPAAEWVGKGGRACKLRLARVTAKGRQVGAVVCVHAKGMKEPSRALRVLPPADRFAMVFGCQ